MHIVGLHVLTCRVLGQVEGHNCVVCPYHGWAFDGEGVLRDVPAAENRGEWPTKQLVDVYPVVEKVIAHLHLVIAGQVALVCLLSFTSLFLDWFGAPVCLHGIALLLLFPRGSARQWDSSIWVRRTSQKARACASHPLPSKFSVPYPETLWYRTLNMFSMGAESFFVEFPYGKCTGHRLVAWRLPDK